MEVSIHASPLFSDRTTFCVKVPSKPKKAFISSIRAKAWTTIQGTVIFGGFASGQLSLNLRPISTSDP